MTQFLIFLLLLSCLETRTFAWKLCSENEGGGICPDETTCCPIGRPGESACIPLVHTNTPRNKPKGMCCGSGSSKSMTACRYGYECVVETMALRGSSDQSGAAYCKATNEATKYDPHARDTPRYDTCRIPEETMTLYGFPLTSESERRNLDTENIYHLAYLSNFGDIATLQDSDEDPEGNIETAIIVVHGSLRDVEDYFCAGLSLIQGDPARENSTMILAPKFATVQDHMPKNNDQHFLVWDDRVHAADDYLFHIWRYGADATNAPISSYTALDKMVEHLANRNRFPNLQQITLVGHSAGGQTLQRWSLLSNSPAWNSTIDIRVVAANARSYAYLDGRRWLQNTETSELEFRLPDEDIDTECPWYNQWLWGLDDGGDLVCSYRDVAIAIVGSAAAIAERYASRDVIYLSGEYDTIPQTKDRCGNTIQGENRHERALRFYKGLQEHFGKPVHTFHTVPRSNHDHALMFESSQGRDAILGKTHTHTRARARVEIA